MILEAINDNVIVKIPNIDREVKTNSGLILGVVNKSDAKTDRGTVIAVGKGRITSSGEFVELSVQSGDEVIFNKYAGTEIMDGDERFLIIKESDILVRIK